MATINGTPNRVDMQAWGYRGVTVAELRQVNSTPGELYFQSSFTPLGSASVLPQHTYAMQMRIRGEGFSDFDANGVPRQGTVTGATLVNNSGFVIYFEGLSLPVDRFLAALASPNPADLRAAFLQGDDLIEGGIREGALPGPGEGDILLGEAGNDTISGHGGHDTLNGGPGNDTIIPTVGVGPQSLVSASVVLGGDGSDTVDYQRAAGPVDIDLARGVAGGDTLSGIEAANGSAFGERLTGGAGAETLRGMGGADTVAGGDGADRLEGGEGADSVSGGAGGDVIAARGDGDVIDGGAGFDTLDYDRAQQAVVVDLATGRGSDTVSGVEQVLGTPFGDRITGSAASERIDGGPNAAADTINAGAGDDVVSAVGYLRGDEGSDTLTGGIGFNDINGNMGDDRIVGGGSDDWVVGGKDNDTIAGGFGADIVYGNLGADTCDGGAGADIVRGGQDDDTLGGGDGDDWISGDRGTDRLSGGTGADIFHTFAGAGTDTVRDFSVLEGDRVQLLAGATFSVAQVGADVVITVGDAQLILQGVDAASLPQGWIFGF